MSQAGILKVSDAILPPDVPLIFDGNSGSGSAIANIFEILGSGGVSTSVVGNILTITAVSSGFTWNVVTSASNPITLANQNGYICKGGTQVVFTLPASAALGDTYRIVSYGNLWTIDQQAGQSITTGMTTSTLGIGGSVTATMIGDSIELVCVTTNLEFYEVSMQGNLTIV